MCLYKSFPFPSHINEDKRKTEGQVQMFEILRDVDGCPVSMSALEEKILIFIFKIFVFGLLWFSVKELGQSILAIYKLP